MNQRDYAKVYQLIKLDGKTRLGCRIGNEWKLDATCQSINEMLENRLIAISTVTGWIATQR